MPLNWPMKVIGRDVSGRCRVAPHKDADSQQTPHAADTVYGNRTHSIIDTHLLNPLRSTGAKQTTKECDNKCKTRIPHVQTRSRGNHTAQRAGHHPERITGHGVTTDDTAGHRHQGVETDGGKCGWLTIDVGPLIRQEADRRTWKDDTGAEEAEKSNDNQHQAGRGHRQTVALDDVS